MGAFPFHTSVTTDADQRWSPSQARAAEPQRSSDKKKVVCPERLETRLGYSSSSSSMARLFGTAKGNSSTPPGHSHVVRSGGHGCNCHDH